MSRIKLLALMLILPLTAEYGSAKDIQPQTSNKQITNTQLSSKDISTKDLIQMTKTPTTPIELLENLKVALDNGLLLREDFYTDENLKQLTGGTHISLEPTNKTKQYLINILVSSTDQSNFIETSFQLEKNPEGKLIASGNSSFNANDPRVSFDKIQSQFFNDSWHLQPQLSEIPVLGVNLGKPTKPHGNEQWVNSKRLPNSTTKVTQFSFDREASVRSFAFRLEEQ